MKLDPNFVPLATFVMLVAFSGTARADHLAACGGVVLDADTVASCEFALTEECNEKCEPVATEKVCASRLTETCDSECTSTADDECITTCSETCVPSCTSEEEAPNCNGLCMSDCQQDCTDACADSSEPGQCRSSCAQCCSNGCDDECTGEPAEECAPVCETACAGSCNGRANIVCQVTCQSDLYTVCEEEVVEECKDECNTSGGAIFCDGQFLATGSDPGACADAIQTEFGREIDVSAGLDAPGLFSCAGGGAPHAALGLVVLAGSMALRRRRAPTA